MAGSGFGKHFCVTTFGESHGEAVGVVIDGCPAGLSLSEEDIHAMTERRRPCLFEGSSRRNESDSVKLLSGIFEGKTTGTPIALLFENENLRSEDYDDLKEIYRPGHADYTYQMKYGIRDHRGGGRASGRETLARVAAGAVAGKILDRYGISCHAETEKIGNCDAKDHKAVQDLFAELEKEGDSVGGTVLCRVSNCSPGLGEPVFDKLDALLAQALFSIGGVKAVEIGDGCACASARGSEFNDGMYAAADGKISFLSNHAGGILGGISTGEEILLRAHFKPVPSISRAQESVNHAAEPVSLKIGGRHDLCIALRGAVVVEAMVCLVLADMILSSASDRMVDRP